MLLCISWQLAVICDHLGCEVETGDLIDTLSISTSVLPATSLVSPADQDSLVVINHQSEVDTICTQTTPICNKRTYRLVDKNLSACPT